MTKGPQTPSFEQRVRIFFNLDWLSPVALYPHGVAGAIALTIGLVITLSSMFGSYFVLNTYGLHAYCAAIFINATAGLLIVNRAPTKARTGFRFACIQQIGLIWFAFRFRPVVEYHFPCEDMLDALMTAAILVSNCVFAYIAVTDVRKD